MRKEVGNAKIDHQIGDQVVSPNLIRIKLDNTYAERTNITTLLAKAHEQFPAWKKCAEMLSAKLWKDHESKGAHKRLALDLEHMADLQLYLKEVEGFIESATLIDNLLKAAGDSLSRQLSCVLTRDASGLAHEEIPTMGTMTASTLAPAPPVPAPIRVSSAQVAAQPEQCSSLDGLDTVEKGIVINESQNGGALVEHDFGVADSGEDNFLSDIG